MSAWRCALDVARSSRTAARTRGQGAKADERAEERERAPGRAPPGLWDPPPPLAKILAVGKSLSARCPGHLGEVVVDNPHLHAAKDRSPEHLTSATRFPWGLKRVGLSPQDGV